MRVLAYVRVSGDPYGRAEDSHDAQADLIRGFTRAQQLPEPVIYRETESAAAEKDERRVELHRLIRDARPGDLVLATLVDRWSRDIVYGVSSVRALIARGVGWISVGESIDASTEDGDAMLGIRAWAADQERKRIYRRTVGTRKRMRDEGLWVEGLPPTGYRVEHRRLILIPEDAEIVRLAHRMCHGGQSVERIRRALPANDRRRVWDKKGVVEILHSRVYLGQIRDSHGTWIRAAHEPVIDAATWERTQAELASRRNKRGPSEGGSPSRTEAWLLRGLTVCALCGARMGPVYGATRDYYGCGAHVRDKTCPARGVHVPDADALVAALILARLDDLRALLSQEPPVPTRAPNAPDIPAHRARLDAQRERVLDMFQAGDLDAAKKRQRLDAIDEKRSKLDAEEARLAARVKARQPEQRAHVLETILGLERAWAHLSIPARRDTVRDLTRKIALLRGSPPQIDWKPLEELLLD